MQRQFKRAAGFAVLALFAALMVACGGPTTGPGGVDPNETAAKVNGKAIRMEEVDRAVKQQAQGQDSRLSPLELAGARLQVLDTLIQQEVMFQKAEKEGTVPSEDEITAEINKQKTQSGKSADQIAKEMADQGMTDATLREQAKKAMSIQKLIEKVTGKIEPPKDSEIQAFYDGNKEAFVKKRGVKLAAIIIDPNNMGAGDTTTDEASAVLRANEIAGKLKAGQDFGTLAAEYSEDQSRLQRGELGYMSEDELKQAFQPETAAGLMNNDAVQPGGIVSARSQGKLFLLKLQERSDKDESLTLESPGVRQQVTDALINNRKQLLAASYQAIAMSEAKIENFLAKKVVDNPNELSGARPAPAANSATTPAANTAPSNANTASSITAANTAKPAGNTAKPANTATKPAANAGANK